MSTLTEEKCGKTHFRWYVPNPDPTKPKDCIGTIRTEDADVVRAALEGKYGSVANRDHTDISTEEK